MADDEDDAPNVEVMPAGERELKQKHDEPPVVARMVIEIRSDGSRTIARGAMEDVQNGQQVAIEAKGNSPFGLALSLARSMFSAPTLARTATRALLRGRKNKKKR